MVHIAVSSRYKQDKDISLYYVNVAYHQMLELFDASIVIVSPNKHHDYTKIARMCDGLLLCGGADITPSIYGQIQEPTTLDCKEDIDRMDLGLLEAFQKLDKPVLGICKGMQIMNVYFGGSMIQDISTHLTTVNKHTDGIIHTVKFNENSVLYDIFHDSCDVNSYHHQAVKVLGKDCIEAAVSEDGIVEAIECENMIAVQWHPEKMMDDVKQQRLFRYFIGKCKGSQ